MAWQLKDGITRVFSDSIRMRQLDGPGLTGAFDLKLNRAGEDNLGLKVGLEGADENALEDLIPSKVVSTELYDWLTTSITRLMLLPGFIMAMARSARTHHRVHSYLPWSLILRTPASAMTRAGRK